MKKTFKTRCGMFIREEKFVINLCGPLSYGGEYYPYNYCGHMRKCRDCEDCIVKAGGVIFCELIETAEPYDDNNSVNKVIREDNKSFYRERDAIVGDGYCSNIVQHFDKAIKRMDLDRCISQNCRNKICHVTGRARTERDLELVNIFYDTKSLATTGFIQEEIWAREQKWFKSRIARDLAEQYMEIIKDKHWLRGDYKKMYNVEIKQRRTTGLPKQEKRTILRNEATVVGDL